MILFHKQIQEDGGGKIIVLFGTGLIGSSICKKINQQAGYSSCFFPFDWDSPEKSRLHATIIFTHLFNILFSCPNDILSSSKIAFVWSAGKAGFAATKKDMDDELTNFDIVIDLVRKIEDSFPEIKIFFHLTSSAGGLFEGQRLVHSSSVPKPERYYGQIKNEQERRTLNLKGKIIKKIYRPTSVYGFVGQNQRMGLIPTLISNGINNKVSTIVGSLSTLRDYVLNEDIGAYINKNLFHNGTAGKTDVHLLGTGKPSSIYEIKHFVEQALGKKIYLRFHYTPKTENSMDITVSSSVLPSSWNPADIKSGIRYVKENILSGKDHYILIGSKSPCG